MKYLFTLSTCVSLFLMAGCVVPTSALEKLGTPLAAATQTAPAAGGFTPAPVAATSDTRKPFPATQTPLTEVPPTAGGARLTLDGDLNVRTGPGTQYERIGWLAAGTTIPIMGRTADSTWWQIPYPAASGGVAWISAGYGTARDTGAVPVVAAPPLPTPAAPTATLPAPTPTAAVSVFQYTPTGWWGDTNYGLTRFMGDIRDTAGNPVNGVYVRAVCGTYSTISYPSGPVGWGALGESSEWPPGFYDITVDNKPVPCMWTLQVVDTDDRLSVKAELSEAVPVEVTQEQSVIQADWRKNW